MTAAAPEIDDYTRRGHERFRQDRSLTYVCGDGQTRTFSQWLEWMKHWDPLTMDKATAERVRRELEEARRGPGIAKRTGATHPAKKAPAAHLPKNKPAAKAEDKTDETKDD